MIVLAAGSILVTTTQKWKHGLALEHLGRGALLIVAAGARNAALGIYLLRIGVRDLRIMLRQRRLCSCRRVNRPNKNNNSILPRLSHSRGVPAPNNWRKIRIRLNPGSTAA